MFGEIVVPISFSWFPKHVVVALAGSILYPIQLHIHRFDHFLMDGIIYYFVCGGVCLYVGPVSKIPNLIHYRVVLFHSLNSGLVDL